MLHFSYNDIVEVISIYLLVSYPFASILYAIMLSTFLAMCELSQMICGNVYDSQGSRAYLG